MTGDVNEVLIYDRVLEPNEVLYLSGVPAGEYYRPVPSNAEIYTDEAKGERWVNFKDYAFLMESWLEDFKWPSPE